MSILFAGNHVSGTAGDVVRFGPLRFWAERGLIHVEDSTDNSYDSFSVQECLYRMRAISDMLGNSTQRAKHSEDQFDAANRHRQQQMLDGMIEVCRRAQIQGMPSDPTARADLKRRAKRSIIVPAAASCF